MDNQSNSNTTSELINSKFNYKFDCYGNVMADCIEDLLYDKYDKRQKKHYLYRDNESDGEESKNQLNDSSNSSSQHCFSHLIFSPNMDFQYIQVTQNNLVPEKKKHNNNKKNKNKKNNNNDTNDNFTKESKKKNKKSKKKSKEYNNNRNEEQSIEIQKTNKKKKREDKYNQDEIDKKEKKSKKKKRFFQNLEIIHIKGVEIKKNKNNTNKKKSIKIILNINNKQQKEVSIDPESNSIKNIIINADKKRRKENASEEKEENEEKEEMEENEGYTNNISDDDEESMNNKSINKIKKFLKKKEKVLNKDSSNNKSKNKDNLFSSELNSLKEGTTKKIHLLFHNIPMVNPCYIRKIRKVQDLSINKIVPKKERVFLTKSYIQKKKNYNVKLVTLPNSTLCYFYKDQKIINVRSPIPLQNVTNNLYFSTKERCNVNDELLRKKFVQKHGKKVNKKEMTLPPEKRKRGERGEKGDKGDVVHTEIDASPSSPNIVIKIVNPLNSSYKYGKINIKTNSPNALKSKSCQKIKNKNSYLINIIRERNKNKLSDKLSGKKKFKTNKNMSNNRYNKSNIDSSFKCLKNREIINAMNNDRYKINCPACITLNKRRQFAEKLLQRNLKFKYKNNSGVDKNLMKIKSLKSDLDKNLSNKIIFSRNEEEKMIKNKIQQYINKKDNNTNNNNTNILPKTNISNNLNNNSTKFLRPNYNLSGYSLAKNANTTHIDFPAIESYFH